MSSNTLQGGIMAKNDWVKSTEIMEIAGCGINEARVLLKKANDQSRKEGNEIPNQFKANRRRIMKMLGLKIENMVVKETQLKTITNQSRS